MSPHSHPFRLALAFTGFVLGSAGGLISCSPKPDIHVAAPGPDLKPSTLPQRKDIEIRGWAWRATGMGGGMQASFTLVNNSGFPVRDITIACIQTSKAGETVSTSQETLHELWRPGESRAVRSLTIGRRDEQTVSSEGMVISFTAVLPAADTRIQ